jgi:hypothetical protein
MRTTLASLPFLMVIAVPALADRPVTEDERAKLVAVVTAAGFSGGKLEWDQGDQEFDVGNAMCDGRKHDLKFNPDYSLKSKKPDS